MKIHKILFYFFLLFIVSTAYSEITESVIPLFETDWYKFYEDKLPQELIEKIELQIDDPKPKIRVMSYNMLMNRSKYEKLLPERHQWPQRKSRLVDYIKYADPDIIGSQELQASQIREIIPDIENEYDYYGISRDNKEESEIEAIFYKKNRFNLIEKKTYWFSETPDIRSKNPYGKQNALTTLTLEDKLTGNHVLLLNVHFSFSDLSSRFYEASFIKNFIQSIPEEKHMILMGDFNTFPFRMDYPHYPFYDGDTVLRIVEKSNIRDAKKSSYFGHLGPLHTSVYTPENGPFTEGPEDNVILDHIYVRGPITVLIHAFDKAKVDGEYPSDHLPVIADVLLHPLDK